MGKIFAESVRNHLDLLDFVVPLSFSLSVLRIAPSAVPELSEDELNELNKRYYQKLCERNDLMLTRAKLDDIHCIRVTGAQKTERYHIERAFKICVETARLAMQEFGNPMLD